MKFKYGAITPKGERLEDTFIINPKKNIYLVADGMGGRPSPKQTSLLASMACYQKFLDNFPEINNSDEEKIKNAIFSSMGHANKVICTLSDNLSDFKTLI